MNGIRTSCLREIEAELRRPDYVRPLRMQASAWDNVQASVRGPAWGRAFRDRAIWRRSLVAGAAGLLIVGAAGEHAWLAIGVAITLAAVFAQCWQFVDSSVAQHWTGRN